MSLNNTQSLVRYKQEQLLNHWSDSIEYAMKELWIRFNENPKCILTESDLKCWMFIELNHFKPESNQYAVHSEVTQYSRSFKDKEKLNFRDLSLLNPSKIIDNEEIWDEKQNLLNKGFVHKGEAIHFELKFIRQRTRENPQTKIPTGDIENFKSFHFSNDDYKRHFVIVWGSRNSSLSATLLKQTFQDKTNGLGSEQKAILNAYLFDKNEMFKCWFEGAELKCKSIK